MRILGGQYTSHVIIFFLLIDVNLHLVDGEDAHPLEADSEGCSPHSVTLAGVQGGVQQLHTAVLSDKYDCLCL